MPVEHHSTARSLVGTEAPVGSMDWDSVRRSYRPERIAVLFVGESPPHRGTFFYCGNSLLFKSTAEAFRVAFHSCLPDKDFLHHFKEAGCYLDDLSPSPINHLANGDRQRARQAAVSAFRQRFTAASPEAVVCVMSGIASMVKDAVEEAGLGDIPFDKVPFPAMGHQRRYVERLASILRRLAANGQLRAH